MQYPILRDYRDTILWSWRNRRMSRDVCHEGIQVNTAGVQVGSGSPLCKVIAAASQLVVDRHPIGGCRVNIGAVDLQVNYLAFHWRTFVHR